jgi:hypothetical protein
MPIPPCARWREHLVPGAALAACWTAGWPGACAVVSTVVLVAVYRLLCEHERRKMLLEVYLNAPAGTEVFQGGGPTGPPMRVRVGNGGDIRLGPGDKMVLPPHTAHAATVGAEGVRCIEAPR